MKGKYGGIKSRKSERKHRKEGNIRKENRTVEGKFGGRKIINFSSFQE